RNLGQLLVSDNASGHITNFCFLFKHGAQQSGSFRPATQRETQIRSGLADLLVARLVLQNREVFVKCGFRLSSLQVLFRFVESLGDVRHWSAFASTSYD